jgi:ferrous iron transport protein A
MINSEHTDSEHTDSEHGVNARAACPLGCVQLGFRGRIQAIQSDNVASGSPVGDLESRLIELGFVEGASVEVLHEGLFGRDPIAVRVDGVTVALRRREAMAIIVTTAAEAHERR